MSSNETQAAAYCEMVNGGMSGLSLSMIVWNEARTIERTILSVRDFVDEVVVGLDTASNDGTEEIVRRLADKVFPSHLSEELEKKASVDDDPDWGFSKARNAVFDACKKDNWRLVLDGHETIQNPEKMAEAIEKAKVAGSDGIEVWVHFEPKNGIPQTMFESTRLMAPTVKYQNANHNVPVVLRPTVAHHIIVEHRKADQAPEHRAARDRQRASANIEGLCKKVEGNTTDPRSWFYLATAYKENARWQEAVDAYQECLKFSRWHEERWHARMNMATCLINLGEKDKAREQLAQALEEFPAMAEAYYALADMAYKRDHFREAEVWLRKCVEMSIPTCKMFINPRVYMSDRYDLLSMVYHHTGQLDKAIEQAKEALKAAPNSRIAKNIQLWEQHLASTRS